MIIHELALESRRQLHIFTVDEYRRMGETGILNEDDRVELIEGEIVEMPPIGNPHRSVVLWLNRRLNLLVGESAFVLVQDEIRMSDVSQPQPDVALLKPDPNFYRDRIPTPDDAFLVIEVADSSTTFDRRVKMPLYAQSGVAEAWIVDLNANSVEIYRNPSPTGYASMQVAKRGDTISPQAFPEARLSVDEILG